MTLGAGALLLGRVTYDEMAQAWPQMGGNPYADHVNGMDEDVVGSEPVDTSAWIPTTLVPGDDLVTAVGQPKVTEGDDILIWGNGELTDALASAGLVDEYRLWVYPVLKGAGEPLFRQKAASTWAPRRALCGFGQNGMCVTSLPS